MKTRHLAPRWWFCCRVTKELNKWTWLYLLSSLISTGACQSDAFSNRKHQNRAECNNTQYFFSQNIYDQSLTHGDLWWRSIICVHGCSNLCVVSSICHSFPFAFHSIWSKLANYNISFFNNHLNWEILLLSILDYQPQCSYQGRRPLFVLSLNMRKYKN